MDSGFRLAAVQAEPLGGRKLGPQELGQERSPQQPRADGTDRRRA